MTTAAGSVELHEIAGQLIRVLASLEGRLVRGDVMHMRHSDLSSRATQFSGYLEAALLLVERSHFPQAFSLLRSGLDHWAADLVIMLGDRFVQHFDNASPAILKDVVDRWRRGELPSATEEPRLVGKGKTKLRIVRRGLASKDGTMVLHPMYFEAADFDPFFGPPDEQADIADWLGVTESRDYATQQRQRYNAFFRWGALVDSLVLNRLVDHRHRLHLNVHHRFLSAFVHSHHGAHELLTEPPAGMRGIEPHATEELLLLYSVQLGARYLRGFLDMAERPPKVGLAERTALSSLVTVALEKSGHLWFLTDEPEMYDRGQELLARVASQRAFRPAAAPEALALAPSEIRYYRNPLDRLRRMHQSATRDGDWLHLPVTLELKPERRQDKLRIGTVMALPDQPADRLDAAALRQALADGEREGIRAEYKREVGTDDRAKAEWALDVSSFANTAGGILLVGAEESGGRLSALPGVPGDVDQEVQRLDSVLRDRVDPAMPGVSIRAVDVSGSTILAVAIPRSWRAPHLVRSGSRWQVARRTSAGKYVLQDAGEIRTAFAETAAVGPRMRRRHDDRVNEVLAGEAPVELADGAFMVVTVQPLGAGIPGAPPVIDIAALRADDAYRHIRPLYGPGDGPRVNVDGLLASASPGPDGKRGGYVQLYRDASLAYVDKKMFSRDRGVPGTAMVENLVDGIARSVAAVEWAGGALPVAVGVSLHGVAGQLFHTDRSKRSFEEYSFDRDRIFLPEVIIDRALPSPGEAAVAIRAALDGLWNAVGVESCEYFDDSGAWARQGR